MRHYIKHILAIAVVLLSTTTRAEERSRFSFVYLLNGNSSTETDAGKISGSISEDGKTATLTLNPADGNYITADNITVVKTINGNQAQTRTGLADQLKITPTNADVDPSGETTYTFEVTDDNYDYEITADFKSRTSIESATITTDNTSLIYTGKAQEPTVTVKLGESTLNLSKDYSVTYKNNTNAGQATVTVTGLRTYFGTKDYSFTIAKATPTLSFSAETASLTMGEEVTGLPTLSNPGELAVVFSSSDTDVATVSEDGAITPVAPGKTTISAAISDTTNYEALTASYVLTVYKAKTKYNLWVEGTQVTEDNAEDILGAAGDEDIPLYLYNPKTNTLIINKDQRGTAVIESRLLELKVYLMEISAIKRIFYNNQGDANNTGKLIFTCNGNVPGRLYLVNNEGESAITGFSDISYEYHLTAFEPDGVEYIDGQMQYAEKGEDGNPTGNIIVAHKVTIGQVIVPTTKEETITFDGTQFVQTDENGKVITDENGNPVPANLSNFTYTPKSETGEDGQAKMLITLNTDTSDPNSGNGFGDDDGEPGIYFGDTMTDKVAGDVADKVENNVLVPGGESYAANYDGFTFILPAGEGTVIVDEEVDEGYEFHLKIGTDTPITLKEGKPGRAQDEIEYKVSVPTYCYLYMVEKAFSARRAAARGGHGTRLGKRPHAHGKIYSVTVSPSKVSAANTPAQASGGVIPPSEEQGDEVETESIQGVKVVNTVDDRWFTIDGRQIDKPTQKGLYIHNRKKVVVK